MDSSKDVPESAEPSTGEVKKSWTDFLRKFKRFVFGVLNLRAGLDRQATVEGIKADVEIKGHGAWILACSILIACIGLSDNNIPIIIGAMLISPLMGPILGIGLGSGINDFELIKKSLINFGVAIFVGLLMSTLYFLLVPVPEVTQELLGRRSASTLAVAVALVGGLAGIIAGSRSYKSNVVPGVAIATALMPPLCTAGFGLATAQWDFFFGALYLFFINSVFIALPTYLYIKYMRFPLKEFVDPVRERKIKRIVLAFVLLIIIPSGISFYNITKNSIYEGNANNFIDWVDMDLSNTNSRMVYSELRNNGEKRVIKIGLMGEVIDDLSCNEWRNKMIDFHLEGIELEVIQSVDYLKDFQDIQQKTDLENRLFTENMVKRNELRIEELKSLIQKKSETTIDLSKLENQISVLFPEITSFSYADLITVKTDVQNDTIPTFYLDWESLSDVSESEITKAEEWLKVQYESHNINVVSQ